MIASRLRSALTVWVPLTALALVGCEKPPELPPAESMSFVPFTRGKAQALTATGAGSTTNADLAAASVGLVSLAVEAALLTPQLVFFGVLTEHPHHDGNTWIWDKTFALAGWQAELRGRHESTLDLEMRVTGLRGDSTRIKDFLWFTGKHEPGHGTWTIYAPTQTGPVVGIDWSVLASTDRDLTFTNVTVGQDGSGDTLKYSLKGSIASMAIHDVRDAAGTPADFSVTWSEATGAGIMKGKDSRCWDTVANGQVDIPCPAGTFP